MTPKFECQLLSLYHKLVLSIGRHLKHLFCFILLYMKYAITHPSMLDHCFLASKRTPKKWNRGLRTSYSNIGHPCWRNKKLWQSIVVFLLLSSFTPTCTCYKIMHQLLVMYSLHFSNDDLFVNKPNILLDP